MPLLRDGMGHAPAWCELTDFTIATLATGESRTFARLAVPPLRTTQWTVLAGCSASSRIRLPPQPISISSECASARRARGS